MMIIYPVERDANGVPTMYSSGPVYTTVNGKRVLVSPGYKRISREAIIKQACDNTEFAHKKQAVIVKLGIA